MKHKLVYFGIGIIALGLGYHVLKANLARLDLQRQYNALSASAEELNKDNEDMASEVEYLSDPHNLEKELRAQNYKRPNEKVIIVAPADNN